MCGLEICEMENKAFAVTALTRQETGELKCSA